MLLQTKLYVPVTRASLVPRPRLLAALDAGLAGRLTLVAAPAGFGKTTLVAGWAHHLAEAGNWAFTWYSLDEGDNDPVVFCHYLIAALRKIDPALGQQAAELLQSPRIDNIQVALTALLNDMAAADRAVVLVLDDYHLITNPAIHDGMRFLLENGPPHFHLVLLSRADPPFSLARLRARNQLTEIRQDDLRFTDDEALHFLQRLLALDLGERAVAALQKRTEGWAAGLQMAGLALQQGADSPRWRAEAEQFIADFSGSHRYIFDYLAEEALARRPAGTRDFLLQTAVLERLCAPLCDALLERDDSQLVLEQLESANLFLVPLDEVRTWYRYHHLFSDLLRHHLRREHARLIPRLHLRASHWFEEGGYTDEAIQHALAAEDYERAAALVARHAGTLIIRAEVNKLLEWIERLPPTWRRQHPALILNHAWANFFRDSAAAVEATLAEMPEEIASRPPYSAYLLLLRGTMAARERDTARAIALAEQAETQMASLPATPDNLTMRGVNALNLANARHWHGDDEQAQDLYEVAIARNRQTQNLLALMNAIRGKGVLLVQQARLPEAEVVFREGLAEERQWAVRTGARTGDPERKLLAAAPLHATLGQLYYEWNRLEQAAAHLVDAVQLLALSGPINRSEALAALARLHLARGEAAAAGALVAELETLHGQVKGEYARRRVVEALAAARCAHYLHYPSPELQAALERSLADLERAEANAVGQAQVLLALGRPAAAVPLLENKLGQMAPGRPGLWLVGAVALCLALHGSGQTQAALAQLQPVLAAALPGGYVRLFVDGGQPMAALLEMATGGEAGVQVEGLLSHFPADLLSAPGAAARPSAAGALAEALSPRETEVLQLIAQGLTNKEIAAALFIAASTAKRHTANVYNKLGVSNRAEATARAFALGLVDQTAR